MGEVGASGGPVLYAGVDEAGYGPRLGPLCVGCAAVLTPGAWGPSEPLGSPACLWAGLSAAVTRGARAKRDRRLPVDDSKRILARRDEAARAQLERSVVAFLLAGGGAPPADDAELLHRLGAALPALEWYRGGAGGLRVGTDDALVAGASLRSAMGRAGVRVHALSCLTLGEAALNARRETLGSKAEASFELVGAHLRRLWDGAPATTGFVAIDRQGGRTGYLAALRGVFPDAAVAELLRSSERSVYSVEGRVAPAPVDCMVAPVSDRGASAPPAAQPVKRFIIEFRVEADSSHLPTALASMTAKLVRETAMARFNAYWGARAPEVKPTAGYAQDARRWLAEMEGVVTGAERESMVRLA